MNARQLNKLQRHIWLILGTLVLVLCASFYDVYVHAKYPEREYFVPRQEIGVVTYDADRINVCIVDDFGENISHGDKMAVYFDKFRADDRVNMLYLPIYDYNYLLQPLSMRFCDVVSASYTLGEVEELSEDYRKYLFTTFIDVLDGVYFAPAGNKVDHQDYYSEPLLIKNRNRKDNVDMDNLVVVGDGLSLLQSNVVLTAESEGVDVVMTDWGKHNNRGSSFATANLASQYVDALLEDKGEEFLRDLKMLKEVDYNRIKYPFNK